MKIITVKKNNMFSFQINAIYPRILLTLLAVIFYLSLFQFAEAATLSLSPNTGVYTSGQTFSVSVRINTEGKPINAAEGTLSFNPSLMSVVSVAKGSLFNLRPNRLSLIPLVRYRLVEVIRLVIPEVPVRY